MRTRVFFVAFVLACLFLLMQDGSAASQSQIIDLAPKTAVVAGGATDGQSDALYIPHGDLLNVRNIQGGTVADPSLDIGAGSSTHRGTIAFNYDVGRCLIVFDGHKHKVFALCPNQRPWFRYKPRYGGRAPR